MKISIITLAGDENYGNKFQNYAVQQKLNLSENNVTTLRFPAHNYIVAHFKWSFLYLISMLLHNNSLLIKCRRRFRFYRFNRNIIQDYRGIYIKHLARLRHRLIRYDKVVYGGDQIWNPEFDCFTIGYLGACSPKKKNIALSASLGIDEIKKAEHRNLFRESLLNNFSAISVREYQGAKIIKDLTGMDVEVLPDPTLTLSREKWEALEKPVSVPNEYYLTYFLGNKPEQTISTIDLLKELSHVSAEPDQPIGPSEFLYLIHRTKYMCTDSFHGCVFSIIYHIPFMLFTRQDNLTSMNSRLTSLFQMLGLKGEQRDGYTFVSKEGICSEIVQNNLKDAVQKFDDFLERNLRED